jgi:hypothetical protein
MSQHESYIRWPADAKIPLTLSLVDSFGIGVVGAVPEVSIRRYRETHGGSLDNYFWTGAVFTATPTYLPMNPIDPVNNPGIYTYLWEQDIVGLETTYVVQYRNLTSPIGFEVEIHVITNEVYIPETQPEPVIINPQSVLGQLEIIKDGGTGLFNSSTDALHYLRFDTARVLGLLHHNAIADRQQYDTNGQLLSCRLRVFDTAAHVPVTPGGTDTIGLLQEYAIEAQYTGAGALTKYALKKVL